MVSPELLSPELPQKIVSPRYIKFRERIERIADELKS